MGKKEVKRNIYTHNSGFIYKVRLMHGKLHEFLMINVYLKCLRLVMRKKNKIIFSAFSGLVYGDNPRYILEKIHELSSDIELIWLRDINSNYEVPDYVKIVDFVFSRRMIYEVASAAVIIDNKMNWSSLKSLRNQLIIQTWHGGLGIKKIGYDISDYSQKLNGCKECDMFLSNSDHITKIYRSAFGYYGPVWKCGYPIEDTLLQNQGEREKIRELYRLSDDAKIFLYAPTFRDDENWTSNINVSMLIKVLEKRFGGDWVLAVRWHPNRQHSNCYLEDALDMTSYPDMQELVKASDAFLSDYSSGIFQAALWGIPCFIYANDYNSYKMERDYYYTFNELPFPYSYDQSKLLKNIEEYNQEYWKERWEQFRLRMGHKVTGHSAEDVAKVCVDFLNGKSKAEIMKEISFEIGL